MEAGLRRRGAHEDQARQWADEVLQGGAMAQILPLVDEVHVMTSLAGEGMTMVVVTHEMGFARRAANRVVFMADGSVVEDAAPEEFFANPRSSRARDFLGKILSH